MFGFEGTSLDKLELIEESSLSVLFFVSCDFCVSVVVNGVNSNNDTKILHKIFR